MSILLSVLSRLPLPVLYACAYCIYLLLFYVVRYRREVVFSNLRSSFPDKSESEIKSLGVAFYRNYSDVAVELIGSTRISKSELGRRVEFKGLEKIVPMLESGKPLLLLGAHQCNLPLMWLATSLKLDYPFEAVYRPISNDAVEKHLAAAYLRFGAVLLTDRAVVKEIVKRRNVTRVIALTVDQAPNVDDKTYWTEFLHQETGFFRAPGTIARFTSYPVFFSGMERISRGYYEVTFKQIAKPPYAGNGESIVQAYVDEVEKQIVDNPADWLWMHRRWKRKRIPEIDR